jgi:hypothetical protein
MVRWTRTNLRDFAGDELNVGCKAKESEPDAAKPLLICTDLLREANKGVNPVTIGDVKVLDDGCLAYISSHIPLSRTCNPKPNLPRSLHAQPSRDSTDRSGDGHAVALVPGLHDPLQARR